MTTRTDLGFLRRRSLRATQQPIADQGATAAATPPPAPSPAGAGASLDLSAPPAPSGPNLPATPTSSTPPGPAQPATLDLGGPPSAQPPAPAGSGGLDLGSAPSATPRPTGGTSLDLGGGEPERQQSPAPSTSLDLGGSGPAPAAAGASGTSLSLDRPAAAGPEPTSRHRASPLHELNLPTVTAGERRLLTEREPVVLLQRLQSAAGGLDVRVAVPNPSEVVLGCVFETSDRRESLVLPGLSQQGPDPRSPIFRATSNGVVVNLRHIARIHRFLVFAVPTRPSRQMPAGTVTATTYGHSRMELPLEGGPSLGANALLSGHVVEGRLVLRAEYDPYSGTLEQVCTAYGYRELSWRDPYTPLV